MKYRLLKNRNLVEDKEFLNKNKWFVGYDKENRAEKLEFEIPDTLNDYAKKINFDLGTEKVSDILNQDNTYILKNNITQYKQVSFYLEFIKEIDNNTTEILKTEVKTIEFGDSFDVNTEITEEEISIIDTLIAQTNSAINRANAISQDLENKVATDYYRGATGENGADAKINGVNTLTIEAGENIEITQEGNKIIISATGVVPPTPTEDTYFITSDDENFITSDGENFIVADEAPTEDIKLTTNDNKEFITSNNANFIVKESD